MSGLLLCNGAASIFLLNRLILESMVSYSENISIQEAVMRKADSLAEGNGSCAVPGVSCDTGTVNCARNIEITAAKVENT